MKKHITEIIDIERLQKLMEKFTSATDTPTAILDLGGNVLVASGWQDICTKFHRVHPETCKNCIESDTSIANNLKRGKKYNVYKCLNGLVDVAIPLVIDNEHIGNLFIGQFLSKEPDKKFFRTQAKKYGFNEKEYMDALSRVPVLSDEDVKKKMDFLSELAALIGEMGMNKLHLFDLTANLEKRIDDRTKELKEAQVATLNMMRDADEARKETERMNKQIQQQQAQLQSMFDGIEDVIYVADPDSHELLFLNKIGRSIWGEDFLGKKCYAYLQGRNAPCPFCTNEKILEKPGKAEIWEFQNEINKHWYRCFDKAIQWIGGKWVRFEMAVDINEIKMAQQQVIKEKAITDSVLDSIPGVFYQINMKGEFERTNKNFQELLGKSPEEMRKINAVDLFEGEEKQIITDAMRKVFEHGISNAEAYMVTQKGKIPFYLTGILQQIDDKPYIIGVGSDITKIKEAEKKIKKANLDLTESNKQLEQFAYVASHDLQEPLRMISSYTQLLGKRYQGQIDEKADKYIHYAVDGAVRMQILINDLLSYSRISTRGKPFEEVDCNQVLGQAHINLKHTIDENKAIIMNTELPTVIADEGQLTRVFQNLIANAIKFRQEETPVINVTVQENNDSWTFCVRDNGIGIDEKYKQRIFIIFQRLHTRAEYPGTGIGLAICKRIINRHGGKIWVESIFGKGSSFFFTLPKRKIHKNEEK